MKIQQLSIFVENKSGRLAEITEALAKSGIDIRAMSVADTSDFGFLRLIVDKPQEAVAAFKEAGMTVSLTSVIAIGVHDRPGEFSKAVRILSDHGINVEYLYAFISREKGKAFVILRVDDEDKAIEILSEKGIDLLTADQIHGM